MKRSLLLLSTFFLVGTVLAQFPSAGELESYKAKLEKSDQEVANEKKAANPKTWLRRAELLLEIAEAPTKGLWTNMTKAEAQLMGASKPLSVTQEEIADVKYEVWSFHACAMYFEKDRLAFTKVLNPVVENPLFLALTAVDGAVTADKKGSSLKKILEAYTEINKKLRAVGSNFYASGDNENAFRYFAAAADCFSRPIVGNVDTQMTYYAGFTAINIKKYNEALEYFGKAHATGYYGENKDGATYMYMARAYSGLKNNEKAEATLLEGFQKFPTNQAIIIDLINHYLTNGENPSKVFPILHKAQANEPGNGSLFFAEGTLYDKLAGDIKARIPKVAEEISAKAKERLQYRKEAEALTSEADLLRYESAKLKRAKKLKEADEMLAKSNQKAAESDKLYAKADAIAKNDVPALNQKINDILAEAEQMVDSAIKLYKKSVSINPSLYDAQFNLGALYYNRGNAAVQASTRLDLKDEAGYKKLIEEADSNYKQALEPLLKAHALQPTERYTIETIKNIYFRFRNNSEEMMAKYKEFNAKSQSNK